MPIQYVREPGEFILWPDATHAPALGVESNRLRTCIDEVKRRRLRGVFGTVPYFREQSLEFLRELPSLEAVAFWDIPLSDISALYELRSLRYLRLTADRPAIEFAKLLSLRAVVWHYLPGDSGIDEVRQLEELYLWRYRPSGRSCVDLRLPSSLRQLSIIWSNVATLKGLPKLPKLIRLEVSRCRHLESLEGLAESCPNLEALLISSSGRLRAEEGIRVASALPSLRHVVAGNRLILDPNAA